MRNGHKQFLMDTNIGKASWEEWQEWIESVNDDLPDPESLDSVWNHMPELSPCLIDGVLRQGHKMLIAGPSKAGKSFCRSRCASPLRRAAPGWGGMYQGPGDVREPGTGQGKLPAPFPGCV